MRIGLLDAGHGQWMGGTYYVANLIRAIRQMPQAEQPELRLVASSDVAAKYYSDLIDPGGLIPWPTSNWRGAWSSFKSLAKRNLQKSRLASQLLLSARKSAFAPPFRALDSLLQADGVTLLFPCTQTLGPDFGTPWLPWVVDLQHRLLPEFFDSDEIARRDREFGAMGRDAPLIVVSSLHARAEYAKVWPEYRNKLRVSHFHTVPSPEWYVGDVVQARSRYHLPERYLILPNQFWVHKNHRLVFKALSILKQRGIAPILVCTGLAQDHRHPNYFAQTMDIVKSSGLLTQVKVLGVIPREHQIRLIRGSIALIQPSLSEGWSTIVEEARALGKGTLLSDILVHREQDPDGAVYFDPLDPEFLADLLQQVWTDWPAGPNAKAESAALVTQQVRIDDYARRFLGLAHEATSASALLARP